VVNEDEYIVIGIAYFYHFAWSHQLLVSLFTGAM